MRPLATTALLVAAAVFAGAWAAGALATDENAVGAKTSISPGALPKAHATPAVANISHTITRPEGAAPKVPAGFSANIFAAGLTSPRWMAVAPNGDVFLTEPRDGKITVLRDGDGDGKAETVSTYASGFSRVHGIAFHGGALYVADVIAVWKLPYHDGDLKTDARPERITTDGFGGDSDHWSRNIAFGRDGALYVAIGSGANVEEGEPATRASVQKVVAGGHLEPYATGLRNPVGIAFYPGSDDLYVTVNERDMLGDDLAPDYLTRIRSGEFFGWPYAYIGPHPDPDVGDKRPDLVKATKTPDVLFRSHSAALGLVFYDAAQFPAEYKGDAFVALHGSWNRSEPTGFKVVRVRFAKGRPSNAYETFATGFWDGTGTRAQVWGRPAGLAVARDGSLLISDDAGKTVWRVSYHGK
jgi:glucose/arabinose dehydrogenase